MTTFTVTVYCEPIRKCEPPTKQRAPMTLQRFDTLDQAVDFFIQEIKALDTRCVQLWQHMNELGRLYI